MQKLFVGTLRNNRNLLHKNFSTLIVPEISNGKIHSSVLNLTKAASQLDNDVYKTLYHYLNY
jgi:hypothetical protein